jgi:hypothetical protein
MITIGTYEHARRIAITAGMFFNSACDQAIVRLEHEKLLGGVIYQGYTGASIRAHIAGFTPRWIDKDMLWMMFHYPFEQLGVNKIIGHVHSTNLKALDFNRKLGFKEEARIEGVFRDADLVIMSMRREECRWLERGKRRGIFRKRGSAARPGHERSHQRGQRSDRNDYRHGQGHLRLGD